MSQRLVLQSFLYKIWPLKIWPMKGYTISNSYLWLLSFFDLWLTKDNRLLNPKSSYERILMAPTCRLIARFHFLILIFIFFLSPSFNNYYLIVASKLMDDLSLVSKLLTVGSITNNHTNNENNYGNGFQR